GRDAVLFAGRENVIHHFLGRLAAWRLVVLAAHAGGQVVGADENRVDAADREDRVGILDRLDMLALQDNEQFVVDVIVIIVGGGSEVQGVHAAAHRPSAERRIAHGGDSVFGFLAAIHHRHDDAVRPVIQYAFDVIVPVG